MDAEIRRDVSVAEHHKLPGVTRAAAEASIAGSLKRNVRIAPQSSGILWTRWTEVYAVRVSRNRLQALS